MIPVKAYNSPLWYVKDEKGTTLWVAWSEEAAIAYINSHKERDDGNE